MYVEFGIGKVDEIKYVVWGCYFGLKVGGLNVFIFLYLWQ